MQGTFTPSLQQAVADAVRLVNAHSGQACVRLQFNADVAEVDLVANSASLQGDRFQFTAGFQTVDGTIGELANIRTEVIGH
jgi:hypothetical protein